MGSDICRYLEWDSEFFGFPIARMCGGRLDQDILDRSTAWCCSRRIRCLYFTADPDDPVTVEFAEHNSFHLVDVRLSLTRHVELDSSMPGQIRPWRDSDLPSLAAIARISHRATRFYFDSGFSQNRCDEFYETWIRNSCSGYADAVLVVDPGQPAGYISCHLDPSSEGRIGLVAIGPLFQGQRLGLDLVHGALHWFASKGVSRVSVVTQGRNIAAQSLYQRCGFRTASTHLFYHRWFR